MFRANKPRAILKEFAGVTPGSPGEKVWAVWSSRALAYFLLQDWPNMEAAAKRLRDIDPHNDAGLEAVAYAAVRRGDIAEAMRMLDAYDSVKDKGNSTVNLYVSVLAAMRQAGQAEKPEFAAVVRRADGWFASRPKKDSESKEIRTAHCEMLYLAGRYAEARQRAEKLAAEFPDDVRLRSYVATAAIRLGDLATARATAEGLRALDPRYRFGYPLFAQAKIATLLGQPDDALRLLREAFAQYTVDMKDFSWQGLLVSPDFDALRSDPRFKEFVAPRG
jgi:predicted Zn-dependent protease